jgi:hypothetical protein
MHSTSAVVGCGESLIVGPGFACLCLSHDTCMERRILCVVVIWASVSEYQALKGYVICWLLAVCSLLRQGRWRSSSVCMSLTFVPIRGSLRRAPRHSTFAQSLAPSACSLSPSTRCPARGIYVHMVHRTADKTRFRFYATPHDSGMRKIKNTMITAPARVSALH